MHGILEESRAGARGWRANHTRITHVKAERDNVATTSPPPTPGNGSCENFVLCRLYYKCNTNTKEKERSEISAGDYQTGSNWTPTRPLFSFSRRLSLGEFKISEPNISDCDRDWCFFHTHVQLENQLFNFQISTKDEVEQKGDLFFLATLNKHTCTLPIVPVLANAPYTQQVRNESGTWKKKLSSEKEKENMFIVFFFKKLNASIAEFSFLVDDEQHIHFSYPVQWRRHLNWIHEKQSELYKGPIFLFMLCFLSLAIFCYLLLHNSWRSRLWTSAENFRISKFGKNTKERRQQKQKLLIYRFFKDMAEWVVRYITYSSWNLKFSHQI